MMVFFGCSDFESSDWKNLSHKGLLLFRTQVFLWDTGRKNRTFAISRFPTQLVLSPKTVYNVMIQLPNQYKPVTTISSRQVGQFCANGRPLPIYSSLNTVIQPRTNHMPYASPSIDHILTIILCSFDGKHPMLCNSCHFSKGHFENIAYPPGS